MMKKYYTNEEGFRMAAGVAVFKGDRLLIVQRSELEDTKQGLWEFAGGKVENCRETPSEVAQSEGNEELGLFVPIGDEIGIHRDLEMKPPKEFHLFSVVVSENWRPVLSFEHSAFRWVTISDLKGMPADKLSHHVRHFLGTGELQ